MTARPIPATFLRAQDGVDLYECNSCGRPMQRDRRRTTPALPKVPRHAGKGRCQGCAQAAHGDRPGTRRPARVDSRTFVSMLTAGLEWSRDARCGFGVPDADVFAMPEDYRGRVPTPAAVLAARKFCARCPVIDECGEFADAAATDATPLTGLWGGEWRTTVGVTPITTKAEVRVPRPTPDPVAV